MLGNTTLLEARRVGLPLLLVMLAGAAGCRSQDNAYADQDTDDSLLRSRPVLTADARGRTTMTQQTRAVTEDRSRTRTTDQRTQTAGMQTTSAAFPTGDRDSSVLLVERISPSEVVVGAPFTYRYRVTNISDLTLTDVFVAETHSEGLEVTAASVRPIEGLPNQWQFFNRGEAVQGFGMDNPEFTSGLQGRSWPLGTLQPGESEVIQIEARADRAGAVNSCVIAGFTPEFCTTMNVVAPSLRITMTAPNQALICEEIPLRFQVTNTGTGTARDVRVRVPLEGGLRTTDAQGTVETSIGDIGPGETREVTLRTRADRPGSFSARAEAVAASGMSAETEPASFTVVQPELRVTIDAPETQYLGRDVPTRVTVTNTSDVVAPDVRVVADLSGGANLTDEAGGRSNSWQIGDLQPGESKSTTLYISTRQTGDVRGRITATARCVEARSDEFTTSFTGIPALLMEVVDDNDPVPVGQETVYTIRITNQGSGEATNVRITTVLPPELEFIEVRGGANVREPAAGQPGGAKRLEFAPLARLAPKASAEWKVRVRAVGAGDVRFGASMTADQLNSPVEETESTNLYR
jgi:uncharacterized repeat protein (TIGR01451 family)